MECTLWCRGSGECHEQEGEGGAFETDGQMVRSSKEFETCDLEKPRAWTALLAEQVAEKLLALQQAATLLAQFSELRETNEHGLSSPSAARSSEEQPEAAITDFLSHEGRRSKRCNTAHAHSPVHNVFCM